jgi:DNA repair protein RadC
MHEVEPHDRPREKLARGGVALLGDNELLAVVLGHGSQGRGALALANDLLAAAGGMHTLARQDRRQLLHVPGIGEAQASRVQAAIELGRRTLLVGRPARPRFLLPRDAALYLLPEYGSHPVERFGILLLDVKFRLLATRIVSTGVLDASLAHPREVFREAVLASAAAVMVFHNHPSGDPRPSPDDLVLTERLIRAGQILGVELVDHLILAEQKYYSMKEARIL